jgi:diketogulonate reductase-like aldo/keto reductase
MHITEELHAPQWLQESPGDQGCNHLHSTRHEFQTPNTMTSRQHGIPALIYGTGDQTTSRPVALTAALDIGYNAVDTASNYTHDEAAVAAALASHAATQRIHVQTKYSPAHFYRTKSPQYDRTDSIPLQVLKSVASSVTNLGTESIDVLLLHQPFPSRGQTYAAWEVLEEVHRQGGATRIGICQVDLATLQVLYENADVKSSVVQNYFAASCGYDRGVRRFCREKGIVYQAFGVFAAENGALLNERLVVDVAARLSVGRHAALLAVLWATSRLEGEEFCVLDGSRDRVHLEENWRAYGAYEDVVLDDPGTFPTALGLEGLQPSEKQS